MIKINTSVNFLYQTENKTSIFVPLFAPLAHWKYKKYAPKELRNKLYKAISNFDEGYVILSDDHNYILEWSDIPEKYRNEGDYLTKGE